MMITLKRAVAFGVAFVLLVPACGGVTDSTTSTTSIVTATADQNANTTTAVSANPSTASPTTSTTVLVGGFDGLYCEDIVSDVIALSEEQPGPFSTTILKIYSPTELGRDDTNLNCEGRALTSTGGEVMIDFYLWSDDEGDLFIGYESRGETNQGSPATDIGSRDNPISIGEVVSIGDWDISVLSVTPDAAELVASENQFNAPPAPGYQYVLVLIEAKYKGADSDSLLWSMSMSVVGESAVVVSDQCMAVVPNELDSFTEVFSEGILTGNLCWEISSSDVDSLVLIIEESFSFDGTRAFLDIS
ncbi:MAG: hypothetical protein OXF41_05400 [bacterium]|nr:hypothetical protein [bacterium]